MKTNCCHALPAILLLAATTLLAGCVTKTTVKDAPRRNVRFASAQAAQTFYETFLAVNHPPPPKVHGWVRIPLPPLPYRHLTLTTDNVRFNATVESTDSNGDGIISDGEATAYAAKAKIPAIRQEGPPSKSNPVLENAK